MSFILLKSALACFAFISNPKCSKLNLWSTFQIYSFFSSSNFNKLPHYPLLHLLSPKLYIYLHLHYYHIHILSLFLIVSVTSCLSLPMMLLSISTLFSLLSESLLNTEVWPCPLLRILLRFPISWSTYDWLPAHHSCLGTSLSWSLCWISQYIFWGPTITIFSALEHPVITPN